MSEKRQSVYGYTLRSYEFIFGKFSVITATNVAESLILKVSGEVVTQ